ncbi:MAG TPA: cyanophycin synthetase, partial [Thermomicrobiales bacterium]|nr:cyanophycin synthetase [Thermomicrobiales bacterium]
PDHLDLQGVRTVETLAAVKAVVCRVTRPGGTVIVNADDPLVRSATNTVSAPRTWFTRWIDSDVVQELRAGGATVFASQNGNIEHWTGDVLQERYALAEIPIAYGGRAVHMIENAMCAVAASRAIGITPDQIRSALATFSNDSEHNPGRLNIYQIGGVTVILDFAHNEAGLELLIDFARSGMEPGHRLISIIGTAGDRTDASLFEIGRVAGARSDVVIAKGTVHYLRGRSPESLMERYRSGARAGNVQAYSESANEITATEEALAMAQDGDCIIIMAQEHIPEIQMLLSKSEAGR